MTAAADRPAPPVPTVPTDATVGQKPLATTVREVVRVSVLEPLGLQDSRYAVLNEGRRNTEMRMMREELEEGAESDIDRAIKMVLIGHRGAGKTTELYRLESELSDLFFPIHVVMDETLSAECDYSLLILQMCEQVCRTFEDWGLSLSPDALAAVGEWFAIRSEVQVDTDRETFEAEVAAKGKLGFGIGTFGGWLMARVRMQAKGDRERRLTIASNLRNRPDELIRNANLLLAEARNTLQKAGRPARLLIVHDNYDRLERDPARDLFFRTGDLLMQIDAACIFTAPVTARLAPYSLKNWPGGCHLLHTIKLLGRDGTENPEGIAAMRALLQARVVPDRVFDGEETIHRLILASGGSVRDLIRLLGQAARYARLDEKERIDGKSVEGAVADMRNGYAQSFFQEAIYYPRLAAIHLTKKDTTAGAPNTPTLKDMEEERRFFETLLGIGAVLEYNGDEPWYDVHPTIRELASFKKALERLRAAPAP